MARFKSTITDKGSEVLTRFLALGAPLRLISAEVGDGIADVSPNTLTALVSPIPVSAQIGEKEYIQGTPSVMKIPVQVSNSGLEKDEWVREVAVYGLDESERKFLFAYSWLAGEDSDNVLPAASSVFDWIGEGEADTVHIHDVAILVTNQEVETIRVEIAGGSFVTRSNMIAYAAPLVHTQAAETVIESTGQSVEEAQRRQDFDLQAIKEQLDTGFTGTTVTHSFAADQLSQWKGYDGTGLPEGILDPVGNRLYL